MCVKGSFVGTLAIGKSVVEHKLLVVDKLFTEIILGTDILRHFKITLDFGSGRILVDGEELCSLPGTEDFSHPSFTKICSLTEVDQFVSLINAETPPIDGCDGEYWKTFSFVNAIGSLDQSVRSFWY